MIKMDTNCGVTAAIPAIRSTFTHVPLKTLPRYGATDSEFLDTIRLFDTKENALFERESDMVERNKIKDIASSCHHAASPFIPVARTLKKSLDTNAPVSNAFVKMIELCYDEEVAKLLNEHGNKAKELKVVCLAEAPGTFPIAIMYYFANRYPLFLSLDRFKYRCTTLPPEGDDDRALGDVYSLMGTNMDKWFLMDHTLSKDTRMMAKTFASSFNTKGTIGEDGWCDRGTVNFVTGDIGKPINDKDRSEYEMFREEFGQFVSACILLKEGGVAVLKMFSVSEGCIASILRTAIGVFEKSKIVKPRTSHLLNIETYWVLSGFKRKEFKRLYEPLLDVMDRATKAIGKDPLVSYPAFYTTDEFEVICDGFPLIKRIERLHLGTGLRLVSLRRLSLECIKANKHRGDNPFGIQVELIKARMATYQPYITEWLSLFCVKPIGQLLYDMTGISSDPKPRPTRRHDDGPYDYDHLFDEKE